MKEGKQKRWLWVARSYEKTYKGKKTGKWYWTVGFNYLTQEEAAKQKDKFELTHMKKLIWSEMEL